MWVFWWLKNKKESREERKKGRKKGKHKHLLFILERCAVAAAVAMPTLSKKGKTITMFSWSPVLALFFLFCTNTSLALP